MKNLILVLGLLLFAGSASAQTDLFVGPTGGYEFNNGYVGVTTGIEDSFLNHTFESWQNGIAFDDYRPLITTTIRGTFDPVETHTQLGHGYSFGASGQADLWIRNHFAVTGDFRYAGYHVTKTSKHSYYGEGGVIYRTVALGSPVRFYFLYFQQVHNGILSNGDETNHTQGGRVAFDVRVGCFNHGCVRLQSTVFEIAHVLNQGNPVCDGTYTPNHVTCPRDGGYTGGANFTVVFEFPRRQPGHEADLF